MSDSKKRKRHSPEQVIAKLREADAMLSAGSSVGQVCQRLGVSEQTLSRWRNQYAGRKVLLILDGHPVHKSRKVKAWIAEHEDEIEVFLLPGYSPELNPDEYLNQDIKANVFKHERPEDAEHMRSLLRRALRERQRQPEKVIGYFQHQDVRYAA